MACEIKETEGCARGAAFALFPTAGGGERDIEQGGENGLADVELLANGSDFLGPDGLNWTGQENGADAHSELLFAFQVVRVAAQALQEKVWVEFNLLRRTFF